MPLPKTNIETGALVLLKTTMSIACSPTFAVQSICKISNEIFILQASVVQRLVNAIHQINCHPVDKC